MARLKALLLTAIVCVMATGGAMAGELETAFHKSAAGSKAIIDHSAWTALLKDYVKTGPDGLNRVDYARLKAEGWWQRRSVAPLPQTVDEAISGSASLLRPSHIFVRMNGQFTEVAKYRFEACSTAQLVSAPSATASHATTAGSTPPTGHPTPGATQAAGGSAAESARTSATGGKA